MGLKYGGVDLEADRRRQAEEAVREELSNVALIEALVSDRDARYAWREPKINMTLYVVGY